MEYLLERGLKPCPGLGADGVPRTLSCLFPWHALSSLPPKCPELVLMRYVSPFPLDHICSGCSLQVLWSDSRAADLSGNAMLQALTPFLLGSEVLALLTGNPG